MIPELQRPRTGSELVFTLLKTLMVGYQLWGSGCSLKVGELAGSLRTSDARLADLLVYLSGEGLVFWDDIAGTVRLTEDGAHHLLCRHSALH